MKHSSFVPGLKNMRDKAWRKLKKHTQRYYQTKQARINTQGQGHTRR